MTLWRTFLSATLPLVGLMFLSHKAAGQIYKMAEMNTRQIRALDRQRTVVLIPGGILEEHGPYLPSYTDGYTIEAYTQELAKAIVARPGWAVVLFPQIPLGNDPANTIGAKWVFPGRNELGNWYLPELVEHLIDGLRKARLEIAQRTGDRSRRTGS